jgi:hypothetical protein
MTSLPLRVAAAAVLLAGVSARAAEPAAELKAYDAAKAALDQLDADVGKRLEGWLSSDNPYQRQAALVRYQAAPWALAPSAADPLLDLLDDGEKRFVGPCLPLSLSARGDEAVGEGEYEALDRCRRGQHSNAELAAGLLPALGNAPGLCAKVVGAVVRKPEHGELLARTARVACSATDLLRVAPRVPAPAAQQVVLRYFLSTGAAPGDGFLPLLSAPDLRTRASWPRWPSCARRSSRAKRSRCWPPRSMTTSATTSCETCRRPAKPPRHWGRP